MSPSIKLSTTDLHFVLWLDEVKKSQQEGSYTATARSRSLIVLKMASLNFADMLMQASHGLVSPTFSLGTAMPDTKPTQSNTATKARVCKATIALLCSVPSQIEAKSKK
mmetsp:Transcript_45598/g.117868  ORF Transcript_45598/g.117868 Transcript_45598/m.117868 type:complete len:109 (+) Transcript_45598:712-1038(+)